MVALHSAHGISGFAVSFLRQDKGENGSTMKRLSYKSIVDSQQFETVQIVCTIFKVVSRSNVLFSVTKASLETNLLCPSGDTAPTTRVNWQWENLGNRAQMWSGNCKNVFKTGSLRPDQEQ